MDSSINQSQSTNPNETIVILVLVDNTERHPVDDQKVENRSRASVACLETEIQSSCNQPAIQAILIIINPGHDRCEPSELTTPTDVAHRWRLTMMSVLLRKATIEKLL